MCEASLIVFKVGKKFGNIPTTNGSMNANEWHIQAMAGGQLLASKTEALNCRFAGGGFHGCQEGRK